VDAGTRSDDEVGNDHVTAPATAALADAAKVRRVILWVSMPASIQVMVVNGGK
jgi:hypothetical protein